MRKTYDITVIENYPDDGNHLECNLPLPFDVKRGEDGYYYRDKKGVERAYNLKNINNDKRKTDDRWIVHLDTGRLHGINPSLERIFNIMVDKDLDKIVDYCFDIYEKGLEMEKKRLEKLRKEFGVIKKPKEIKVVGVISYTIEDFQIWKNLKRHKPNRKFKDTTREYTFRNVRYICLSQPEHVCGHTFDKVVETTAGNINKSYDYIKSSAFIRRKIENRYVEANS